MNSVTLSPRERSVLLGYAQGLTDKEIAANLRCSYGTAREYGKRLRKKVGGVNHASTVVSAIKRGLLDPMTVEMVVV